MNKPPKYWYKAKKILSKRDPVFKKIIKKYNKGYLTSRNKPFFSLCRTIIGQQISTKAADSIWSKFETKCKKLIFEILCLKQSMYDCLLLSYYYLFSITNRLKSFLYIPCHIIWYCGFLFIFTTQCFFPTFVHLKHPSYAGITLLSNTL